MRRTVWWLKSNRMTVRVVVDEQHRIVEAANVVKRFIGQPLENLAAWMNGHGGFEQMMIGTK